MKFFQPFLGTPKKCSADAFPALGVSLFNQFYAVYQVFPAVPLPGQQELSRATNFSTLLRKKKR